jgi:beta-lactamase class A
MIAVGILEQVAAGQIPYSQVRSDLSAMIRVSSNASAQRLYRRMGRAAEINDLADRYGMGKTKPGRKWGVTKTTADDQVLLLRRALLDDPPTLPAVQQRRLLRLMRKVAREQRWGAGYGLPPGWTAAVKNGWYHTVPGDEPPINRSRVNTTGIVFDAQGKPRWVIAGFSNRWRTDRAGIRAWNALSKHVARVLAD